MQFPMQPGMAMLPGTPGTGYLSTCDSLSDAPSTPTDLGCLEEHHRIPLSEFIPAHIQGKDRSMYNSAVSQLFRNYSKLLTKVKVYVTEGIASVRGPISRAEAIKRLSSLCQSKPVSVSERQCYALMNNQNLMEFTKETGAFAICRPKDEMLFVLGPQDKIDKAVSYIQESATAPRSDRRVMMINVLARQHVLDHRSKLVEKGHIWIDRGSEKNGQQELHIVGYPKDFDFDNAELAIRQCEQSFLEATQTGVPPPMPVSQKDAGQKSMSLTPMSSMGSLPNMMNGGMGTANGTPVMMNGGHLDPQQQQADLNKALQQAMLNQNLAAQAMSMGGMSAMASMGAMGGMGNMNAMGNMGSLPMGGMGMGMGFQGGAGLNPNALAMQLQQMNMGMGGMNNANLMNNMGMGMPGMMPGMGMGMGGQMNVQQQAGQTPPTPPTPPLDANQPPQQQQKEQQQKREKEQREKTVKAKKLPSASSAVTSQAHSSDCHSSGSEAGEVKPPAPVAVKKPVKVEEPLMDVNALLGVTREPSPQPSPQPQAQTPPPAQQPEQMQAGSKPASAASIFKSELWTSTDMSFATASSGGDEWDTDAAKWAHSSPPTPATPALATQSLDKPEKPESVKVLVHYVGPSTDGLVGFHSLQLAKNKPFAFIKQEILQGLNLPKSAMSEFVFERVDKDFDVNVRIKDSDTLAHFNRVTMTRKTCV
eukprot:TRINITY_DN13442_c0_g1_i1.p1 TRINITY_DN13442_c0_g1~~TRINITY_DN13442_c0_g1_i1.p1  ORF type:complete len:703 (+),score=271.96 TRINITY_DN13442_c0_g1_i1:414-2522(+)